MNKKHKIIYVDDEQINLMLFEASFNEKYTVITANNGLHGLKILNENTDCHVIISDMRMPGMNGLEFIKAAKEKYPDKKFYILTGFEITDEIEEALNSGIITGYFSKPIEMKKIHKILSTAFNSIIKS